jgi:iron(III) transport system substrate-binding protein
VKASSPITTTLVLFAVLATACATTPTPVPLPLAPTIIAPTAPAPPTVGPTATKAPLKGELNLLCSAQEEWCAGMKQEFQTKYPGVTVKYVRLLSREALTRLRNDKANPQFDIWWGGSADSFIAAKKDGMLDPYKSNAQANIIDQKLMIDQDATPQWVGIYVDPLGFATNNKQTVIKSPASLDDLIKPEMKGQIAIPHPAFSNASFTFLCTVLQVKGEKDGWDYMKKLSQNVMNWTRSDPAPIDSVGKGEAVIGLAYSHEIIAGFDKGYPLTMTFPGDGTGYELGAMGMIKGAKTPDLAKAWYDWALLASTQELAKKYKAYQGLTIKGAVPPRPELLQVRLANYNFDYCSNNMAAFVDKFSNEIAAAPLAK